MAGVYYRLFPPSGVHSHQVNSLQFTPDAIRESAIKMERETDVGAAQIVAIGCTIMRGAEHLGMARSHTMAKRIARALNQYHPNRRGC